MKNCVKLYADDTKVLSKEHDLCAFFSSDLKWKYLFIYLFIVMYLLNKLSEYADSLDVFEKSILVKCHESKVKTNKSKNYIKQQFLCIMLITVILLNYHNVKQSD